MSTKYGRNFTSFQNISLKGSINESGGQQPPMVEMFPGVTQAPSTLSISMIGSGTNGSGNSANEHPYFHVSNAGLSVGTGFIRMTNLGSSPYGTLRLSSLIETDTAYRLHARSGGIGITGTFVVQLPAVTSWTETAVTVTGVRREDAVVCMIQDIGYTVTTERTQPILTGARPENGYIYLTFYNPTGTATLYSPMVVAYTAFR